MKNVIIVAVLAVCMMFSVGCRQSKNNTTNSNGTVTEVASPFSTINDFLYYHDLEEVDGRLYLMVEISPTSGAPYRGVGQLYVKDPSGPWSETGQYFSRVGGAPNDKGSFIVRFPDIQKKEAGFIVRKGHNLYGPGISSSIYQTVDGGSTFVQTLTNRVNGSIHGLTGHWDATNSKLVLDEYGGAGTMGNILERWDTATQQFVGVALPTPNPPVSFWGQFDKKLNNFYGPMDREMWALLGTGGPWFGILTPLPAPLPWSLLTPEDVLSVTNGLTSQGAGNIPPLALGRYGLRRTTGYEQYPTNIVLPVIGAYANRNDAWLVDSSETVWYSRDQGTHWSNVHTGAYPQFYTDGKVENRVLFADGKDGMWILSAGTQLLLHKYR